MSQRRPFVHATPLGQAFLKLPSQVGNFPGGLGAAGAGTKERRAALSSKRSAEALGENGVGCPGID